jgi:hypothetical protein
MHNPFENKNNYLLFMSFRSLKFLAIIDLESTKLREEVMQKRATARAARTEEEEEEEEAKGVLRSLSCCRRNQKLDQKLSKNNEQCADLIL